MVLHALRAPAFAALGADSLGLRARVFRAGAPASGPRSSGSGRGSRRSGPGSGRTRSRCTCGGSCGGSCGRRGTWGRGAGPRWRRSGGWPRLLLLRRRWWCAWPLLLWGWGPRGSPGGALLWGTCRRRRAHGLPLGSGWSGRRLRRPRRPWRCRSLRLSRSRRGVDEGEDAGAAGALQLQIRRGFLRGEPESAPTAWAEDRHDRPTSSRLVRIIQIASERLPLGSVPMGKGPWSVPVRAVDSHANSPTLRGQCP